MKNIAPLVMLVATLGCSSQPKIVIAPDGQTWLAIKCSTKGDCYERAGRACRGGYVVNDTDESSGAVSQSYSANGTTTMFLTETKRRELLIRCKRPPRTIDD